MYDMRGANWSSFAVPFAIFMAEIFQSRDNRLLLQSGDERNGNLLLYDFRWFLISDGSGENSITPPVS